MRWAGPDTERCQLGDRSFAPLAGACWFPIDLLTPEGPLVVRRERGGRSEEATLRVARYPYKEQHLEVDERMVHLSPEDSARVEREEARVLELWAHEPAGPPRFTLPLGKPLAKLPGGGRFGTRRWFNGEPRSPHSGVDYRAAAGTPVLAPADGVVALAEAQFFSGNSVYVDHGGGLLSMCFHLSRIDVKPGEVVRRGQRVGAVGATGRASGPHLHFGIRWHGARVDPGWLLRAPAEAPAIAP